ncbi:hypothetical protein [Mammaliicoccus sciuri]|uniref:hypothetical protein n=1 Tax=Mammaliicoccus sciuri TaxID=1296 RepID=UPI001951DF07|nr:hypothetical protein [Mammaliicoccus sciuri]MCJ0919864.1 hypothetical protein [Mammaliicoccus sciuri]MCJ0962707.1 hypothetical protein [Mammaliicoccus sciuri]
MIYNITQNVYEKKQVRENEYDKINIVVDQLHEKVDDILRKNKNDEKYEIMNILNNNFVEKSVNFDNDVFKSVFVNFNFNKASITQELHNEKLDIENLNKIFNVRERMGKRILRNLDISSVENAINFNNNIYIDIFEDIKKNIQKPIKKKHFEKNYKIKIKSMGEIDNEYNFD